MGVKIMIKTVYILGVVVFFFVLQVEAESNLTKKQIENARVLLKEYAFMSCLKEGFNKELNRDNQQKEKNTSTDKIFRLDLIYTMKKLALDRYGVYHIEDNMKQVSKKELAVYIKIDEFIKENYSKIRRVNTPFIMNYIQKEKRTVYLTCFDLYHSKELDALIKKQDKYISNKSVLNDIIIINNSEVNNTK